MIAYDVQIWLGRIAGAIIIFFGFYLLGLVKPDFHQKEHSLKLRVLKAKS